MFNKTYKVIGVMSGTSLDGIDLAAVEFTILDQKWNFKILEKETISYSEDWVKQLKEAVTFSKEKLTQLNENYTILLGGIIKGFINKHQLKDIDAVCSHGHTILHQPQNGFTLQIGNLPNIAEIIGTKVTKQISMEDILVHDYQDTFFEKKETENEPTSDSSEPITEEEIIEEINDEGSLEVEPISESTPEVEIEIVSETKEEIPVVNGKAIVLGLNDKIAFEKNLFAGNGDDLNRVLSQLNTFTNWEEAKSFVLDFVKPDYNNWENKEEFEVRFLEIVENKFK